VSQALAKRASCTWDVSTSESASLIAKWDYAKYTLIPGSTGSGSTFESFINSVKAINPKHKAGVYTIAYELGHTANQISSVQSITRSGTTVTITTQNLVGTASAPPVTNGAQFAIMQAGVSAYNGTWTCTGVSGNTMTFTASGAAATAADDTSGQALVCPTASTIYQLMSGLNMPTALKDQQSWFTWKQGTSGRRTMWTTSFGNWFMNLTNWPTADSQGNQWPQWMGKWYRANLFNNCNYIDFAFIDNFIDLRQDVINDNFTFSGSAGSTVRGKSDWKGLGGTSWQNYTDSDVQTAHRQGLANFAAQQRTSSIGATKSANIWVMGNHDSANGTLPGPMAGALDAAFDELFLDTRSTSLSSWVASNFSARMSRYAAFEGKFATNSNSPGIVVQDLYVANATDYENVRFGIAMSYLRDIGAPCVRWVTGNRLRYDELDVLFGSWVDGPQSAAYSGTLWKRENAKVLVLLNAGAANQSIDLTGKGWYYINGTVDTTVNTGAAITGTLTLAPYTARILVKP
jgi:hypothetical protein